MSDDDEGKLVVTDNFGRGEFRIAYYFADEGEYGAVLGEGDVDGTGDEPVEHRDFWLAHKVCIDAGADRDERGFTWESKRKADAVLRQILSATSHEKSLPEWALKAIAEGWKAPKGWKP